jgi:hypothetical protein
MAVVVSAVDELANLSELTGPGAASVFERLGWSPLGRNPGGEFETTWENGEVSSWIQRLPDGVEVEILVWRHEVDDDVLEEEEGLERLYEEAESIVPQYADLVREAFSSELSHSDFEDEAEEFISYEAWSLREFTLLVGAKQDDTDVPVEVVFFLR